MPDLLIFKERRRRVPQLGREHPGGVASSMSPSLMLHHPDCDNISDLMTKAC